MSVHLQRVGGTLRRYGWLPTGQAIAFLISIGGFAILARVLGPGPYAKFAVILFVFTATSLLADLSPQGFAIVMGHRRNILRVTLQLAALSAGIGVLLLAGSVHFANVFLLTSPITVLEQAALAVALIAQMLTQVPRAALVLAKRFRAMALIDVAATASGLAVALIIGVVYQSGLALTAQLAALAIVRALATVLALGRGFRSAYTGEPIGVSLRSSIAYGVRVIPLNLASYLSRSLDSGILPAIIPAAAAAGYARSYQVVIVPITQLQLSLGPAILEKLSRGFEKNGERDTAIAQKLWNLLQAVAAVSGISIALMSPVIHTILFGPGWPMVNVMITAMGCLLPAMATATYCSWTLQVRSNLSQTAAHLGVMMVTPSIVIAGALIGGTQLAVVALVVGAGVQSAGLVVLHRGIVPGQTSLILLRQFCLWGVMAGLFVWVATAVGFWTFQF